MLENLSSSWDAFCPQFALNIREQIVGLVWPCLHVKDLLWTGGMFKGESSVTSTNPLRAPWTATSCGDHPNHRVGTLRVRGGSQCWQCNDHVVSPLRWRGQLSNFWVHKVMQHALHRQHWDPPRTLKTPQTFSCQILNTHCRDDFRRFVHVRHLIYFCLRDICSPNAN